MRACVSVYNCYVHNVPSGSFHPVAVGKHAQIIMGQYSVWPSKTMPLTFPFFVYRAVVDVQVRLEQANQHTARQSKSTATILSGWSQFFITAPQSEKRQSNCVFKIDMRAHYNSPMCCKQKPVHLLAGTYILSTLIQLRRILTMTSPLTSGLSARALPTFQLA